MKYISADRLRGVLLAVLFCLLTVLPAAAQQSVSESHTRHNELIDAEGVLTWDALANLDIRVETPAPLQTLFFIEFPESLLALDGEPVRLKGFMYPLEAGEAHDSFLLSALPPACPFCLPGNSKTLVDVKGDEPIRYTLEPVLLEGRFVLIKGDESGLYYRLAEARQIE